MWDERERRPARIGAVLLGALLVVAPPPPAAASEDASPTAPEALVRRTFENLYGFHSLQTIQIRSRSARGQQEFVREAQIVRQGLSGDRRNRMLVRLLGPGELRGVGLLLLERDNFEYDAFLYQPALRKVRRITVAQRGDSFLGTDLFFEDFEARRASQWRVRYLRDEGLFSRRCAVIELVPKGFRSGYERLVAWLDRELPVMLRIDFFRDGGRIKTAEFDPARIVEKSGYHVPLRITLRGAQGSVTTVEISELEIRTALAESLFTRSTLELGNERTDARPIGGER